MTATHPLPGIATQAPVVPARALRLPGCDRRLAYAAHYWPATVMNLLRRHRLRATVDEPRLSAPVSIPPALRRDWQALFDADAACPLLVNQSVGTLLYTRLFGQLGLNFRRLLHVQHRTEYRVGPETFAAAAQQSLVCELDGCWRLAEDKGLVVLRTQIHLPAAEGGGLLAAVEDRFVIRHVPTHDWAQLPPLDDRHAQRDLSGLRRRRPGIDVAAAGTRVLPLQLPADLGRRYGRVSGDHNPVHTTALAARLFGLPRPFAQGLALRNLIVSELHRLQAPLQRLQLTFAQPAYLGQTLRLVLRGDALELLDEAGRVLVFGRAQN
ncbi:MULTISPECIES: MaoC/PaaZ C-terminal domain-containing protein [unclassified Roseateles]|uniref:MaoC/PaaZ C-terminal domain-containing protein n=1 Tax=unclassified Roseateles TaxID=2626991 RepID=UPI0006FD923F|nr:MULTISPECIES: MaoC/PaaZ C-terminal domain-containing protein [unclassified Roseateles]KQW52057.1 hypothetical protein ASC81_05530 [Pelomonas sp. Root405]KRA78291.1 hypothetical protein ASD88_05535 [Pelomonas sp. Root662]